MKKYISNKLSTKLSDGLTLIEILIVMGVMSVLLGFIVVNLIRPQISASVDSATSILLADLKQQQVKAMVGENGAVNSASASGIYFGSTSYTLFYGTNYSANNSGNITIDLGNSLKFTNNKFTNQTLVFATGSGEVYGFTAGKDSVTISNPLGGKNSVITVNRYGAVTGIE